METTKSVPTQESDRRSLETPSTSRVYNHELLIKTLQKKFSNAKQEISTLNQEIIKKDKNIENLERENYSLQKRLGQYREMVSDLKFELKNSEQNSAIKQSELRGKLQNNFVEDELDKIERRYEIFEEVNFGSLTV